ncbi:MAG: 3-deoxy-manno-octulosonate cytidylyltransferase [Bacteroidota bacterium]|jgi:3-deoxy-manno-octulosonate cytidylyltransferase (CMP-KDO synthetase)
MKVLGIIPARHDSSRFPGKPLIDLKGKTMIQRVYEGALKAQMIDTLVVATDDARIEAEVLRFGGKVLMTSAQHQSGTDRCAEVLAHFPGYDVVINIQGDEPLVSAQQLDALLGAFQAPEVQIATLVHPHVSQEDLENPNRIKVLENHKQTAIYFSRSPLPNMHYAKMNAFPWLRHIGLYAYRSSILKALSQLAPCLLEQAESLEQLRWLYYGYPIHLVRTTIETPNIDVPEDVQKVLPFL